MKSSIFFNPQAYQIISSGPFLSITLIVKENKNEHFSEDIVYLLTKFIYFNQFKFQKILSFFLLFLNGIHMNIDYLLSWLTLTITFEFSFQYFPNSFNNMSIELFGPSLAISASASSYSFFKMSRVYAKLPASSIS